MKNPQLENGYTMIANEILQALCCAGLNGTEWDVIMCVVRMTYGYHKKEDWISYTQFEKMTGKSRPAIWKAIISLVNKRLLVNKHLQQSTTYGFNKRYSEWVVNKRLLVNKQKSTSKQIEMEVVNKRLLTKESITKESIQKKVLTKVNTDKSDIEYGNEKINKMLIALKDKIGIDDFADSQKWSRIYGGHCCRLLEKLGKDEFVRRLEVILQDNFKRKNCNKIRYIYEQIKGFVNEPSNFVSV